MYEFGNDRLGDEGVVRHGMMMLLREIDALAVGGGDVCEFSVVPICRMMKNSTNSSLLERYLAQDFCSLSQS